MEKPHLRYLRLLNAALTDHVLPAASTAMAGHTGLVCARLLNRILVAETQSPGFFGTAVAGWQEVLDEVDPLVPRERSDALRRALQNPGDPAAIERALEAVVAFLGRSEDTRAREAARRLVGIDAALRKAGEDAYEQLNAAATKSDDQPPAEGLSEYEQASLLAYIRKQIPGETELTIARQNQVPGGFSKQTIILGLANNRVLPAEVVVRRDGVYLPSGNSVTFEYPIIRELFDAGVAVPQPFLLDAAGEALSRPFLMVARVEGRNFGDSVEVTEPSRALGLDLARQMAALHAVDVERFGTAIPGATVSTRERLAGEIASDRSKWNAFGTPSFIISAAFDWLQDNVDQADGPRALVHRDIGAHNMLVRNDRVMALLDWEIAVIGNPAEDIGYAADMLRQMMDLEEFIAVYNETARHPANLCQIEFYDLWASVRLTVLIGGARQGVLAGQLNDVKLAYVSEHFGARLMQRVAIKLHALLR